MSPAYRAHPEFGYLCPSRSFRRKLWMALAVTAFGALAGAVVFGSGHDPQDGAAPPSAPVTAASSSAAPVSIAESTTAARPGPPESPKVACEGETWTYLDGKCVAGKAPKPRIAAIDPPPIAAIPLGRTAPPPPAAASPPAKAERAGEAVVAPVPPSKPEPVAEAPAGPSSKLQRAAEATATAAAEPTGQSSSASKERRKVSRDRTSRDDRRSARASSPDNRTPKSAMGWSKQVRGAEQFMRAILSSGI